LTHPDQRDGRLSSGANGLEEGPRPLVRLERLAEIAPRPVDLADIVVAGGHTPGDTHAFLLRQARAVLGERLIPVAHAPMGGPQIALHLGDADAILQPFVGRPAALVE